VTVVHRAWLTHELVTDLGIISMMLAFQACKMQVYGVMEASTQISKKTLRGQVMGDRVRVPTGIP
jgi:hypothetical protein